ncbi:MAG: hypothetical protein FWD61_04775 [Phycisphaerales bacterium]|nr:hypothetical protein [Phycisphaerales bacterium]
MLTIKPLTIADIPAARRMSDHAGWNQLDVDWDRLIALWPQTVLGGWLGDKLVATASLAHFEPIRGERLHLGWIGVMLVDVECRGAGYGGKIFDAVMQCGADRGITDYGLDATDLGRPLYVKRGFTDRFGMNRWVCKTPAATALPIEGIRPLAEADWHAVAAMDHRASRVNRTLLLKRLAQEPGAHAIVAEAGGKRIGFAMYRAGRIAAYIGPIVAEDPATASKLCQSLIAAHNNPVFPLFADVAAESPLESCLHAAGFIVARKLIRMGKAADQHPLAYSPMAFTVAGLELC